MCPPPSATGTLLKVEKLQGASVSTSGPETGAVRVRPQPLLVPRGGSGIWSRGHRAGSQALRVLFLVPRLGLPDHHPPPHPQCCSRRIKTSQRTNPATLLHPPCPGAPPPPASPLAPLGAGWHSGVGRRAHHPGISPRTQNLLSGAWASPAEPSRRVPPGEGAPRSVPKPCQPREGGGCPASFQFTPSRASSAPCTLVLPAPRELQPGLCPGGEPPAVGGVCRPASPTESRSDGARPSLPSLTPSGPLSGAPWGVQPFGGTDAPMPRFLASYPASRGGPAFRVLAGASILPAGDRGGEETGRRGAQSARAYLRGPGTGRGSLTLTVGPAV